MKFFTNKNITKKLIIVLVFLTLFNFCYPKTVKAGDTVDYIIVGAGNLFFGIFDGILKIANRIFVGDETTTSKDLGDKSESIKLTPESIIKGKFLLMDANIFKDVSSASSSDYYDIESGASGTAKQKVLSGKIALRKTISGWYYALRNLAIVALLTILVYVAIRMILSSVSADKAKYKMMFKDWLVALCLLFIMHYLMAGILNISSLITDAIGTEGKNSTMVADVRDKIQSKLNEALEETDNWGTDDSHVYELVGDAFGYIFIYAAITIFTIIFAVKYIIRALTITFLALIAPITCITYPVDKLGDGKAQAFEFWFKEFLMEAIIQPFHLLLYVVLIGASVELSEANVIYSIICYAIMLPAEKFIKQMFGINEKLGSPLSDMASVAAASGLAKKATGWLGKGSDGKKGGSSSEDDAENNLPPRQRGNMNDYDEGEKDGEGDHQLNPGRDNNTGEDTQPESESEQLNGTSEPIDRSNEIDNNLDEGNLQNGNTDNNIEQAGQSENERVENIDDAANNNEIEESNANDNLDSNSENSNAEQNNENDRTQVERKNSQTKQVGNVRRFARGVRAGIAKDVRKKHGTTNAKKLAIKGAKSFGKGVLRAGLAGIGAGVLGMAALATGNSKAVLGAMGAGAALGNAAGRKISGVASTIGGTAGRYYKAGRSAVKGESAARKKQKEKFMQNQRERDYATQRLQEKNGGQIPSKKEVDAELEKRWAYHEAGIKDNDVIDAGLDLAEQKETDFLNNAGYTEEQRKNYNDTEQKLYDNQEGVDSQIRYKDAYEQLQKGEMTNEEFNREFGEGEAEKARDHQIMEDKVKGKREIFEKQALFAASIADSTSKSDFMDKKKMANLQESHINDYMIACKAQGKTCSREQAERVVNSAINDAAKIKGVKSGANLPGREERSNTQQQPQQQTQAQQNSEIRPTEERRARRRTRIEDERRNQRRAENQRRRENQRAREKDERSRLAGGEPEENKQAESNTRRVPKRVKDSQGKTKKVTKTNKQPINGEDVISTNPNNGPIV